MKFNLQKNK